MKIIRNITAVAVVVTMFAATEALAQRGAFRKGSGGWGPDSPYGRMYNPKTVQTLSGEVARIDTVTPLKGMGRGVHLQLKTVGDSVEVHLGPRWFIDNQETKIEDKDKIEVTGSRVTLDGKSVIIAAELKKGDQVLKLRDEAGIPAWSGWRRR